MTGRHLAPAPKKVAPAEAGATKGKRIEAITTRYQICVSGNSVNDPALRRKMLQRLDVMRREAEHTIRAIDVMRGELTKQRPFPSSSSAHALKQSRGWS